MIAKISQDVDWTAMRLELAAQGKSPEQIEKIVDRWYRACLDANADNSNRLNNKGANPK